MTQAAGHSNVCSWEWWVSSTEMAKWNKKDYVQLYKDNKAPSAAAEDAALVGDVYADIKRQSLCYSSNVQRY